MENTFCIDNIVQNNYFEKSEEPNFEWDMLDSSANKIDVATCTDVSIQCESSNKIDMSIQCDLTLELKEENKKLKMEINYLQNDIKEIIQLVNVFTKIDPFHPDIDRIKTNTAILLNRGIRREYLKKNYNAFSFIKL